MPWLWWWDPDPAPVPCHQSFLLGGLFTRARALCSDTTNEAEQSPGAPSSELTLPGFWPSPSDTLLHNTQRFRLSPSMAKSTTFGRPPSLDRMGKAQGPNMLYNVACPKLQIGWRCPLGSPSRPDVSCLAASTRERAAAFGRMAAELAPCPKASILL